MTSHHLVEAESGYLSHIARLGSGIARSNEKPVDGLLAANSRADAGPSPLLLRGKRMAWLTRSTALAFGLFLVPAISQAQGFHNESIMDPALNMKAYDVSIPNGWKYQGTIMQGDSCSNLASPVWRAYSPDGLSEFRRLPRFDWSWSNAPYAPKPQGDCLALTQDASASDFIRYLGGLLQLKYVGPASDAGFVHAFMQNIEKDNAGIQAAAGQRPFRGSAAAARFEDQNGSFVIEEQIRAGMRCSHHDLPGFASKGKLFQETCGAEVRIIRAPKGKLDALIASLDANGGFREDSRWTQAVISISQQRMAANAQQTRQIMAARQVQFQQAQAVRARQNQEYQAATKAGYDSHNASEARNMAARHTPASDWVDYALDQQTVSGTGGNAVKVSSAYSQTWANGQGQFYETNNPNANPNGSLPGNWTLQSQVHGNGQPH
ncbi:MAG TPA: hypothetical protein VGN17_20055 [Bryobacteraceae bacterium]|jgi:hypothetical protein